MVKELLLQSALSVAATTASLLVLVPLVSARVIVTEQTNNVRGDSFVSTATRASTSRFRVASAVRRMAAGRIAACFPLSESATDKRRNKRRNGVQLLKYILITACAFDKKTSTIITYDSIYY